MKSEIKNLAKGLISFIDASPTAFHATENIETVLKKNGFSQLPEDVSWKIKKNGKYFVKRNDSSIIAFITGSKNPAQSGFHIIGAHTDSPLLKIKTETENCAAGIVRVATETYGGPLINTWFDRDLGIAGKVMVKTAKGYSAKLLKIDRPVAIIPSLAIHLNREANKGFEFNPQNHLQAVISTDSGSKDVLKTIVAKELKTKKENVGEMDIFLYDLQKGTFYGSGDELISSGRIDNLQMCHAILEALLSIKKSDKTLVAAFYDNEEIGSKTLMGADSNFTKSILERITLLQCEGKDDFYRAISKSFLVSADGAHAQHPNFPEKHDPGYVPKLNKGPVIKLSASFRYATTAESSAYFAKLCETTGVPFQKMANRSDVRSGSTIGPLSSASLGIKAVDVGNAMWAMHSIRETAGTLDHWYMTKVLTAFLGGK
ncbi:MAG TPA: M18 family aminopeptidase [bacterium]|nr:M18 family aminopeptidase [bacterium]